ncbi:hypothetical protein GGX14DRAFT_620748 [Mycena pura]|uniref:F-box domain-containing protein n=1 Tax=Mycena pura TaxID=153505 RepID=A0AAD6VKA1_9AGAR|nr:hypothetical protein GGX14DRAFT_620748 [Mycena pura]
MFSLFTESRVATHPAVSVTSGNLTPHHLLPTELWDCILQEVADDDDLFRLARACKTFNGLCIRTLLRRNGFDENVFVCSKLLVSSHILPVLSLSFRTFPLEQLLCDLAPPQLRRDLNTVQNIISQSPHLRELSFLFRHDLFKVAGDDASHSALMATFCATLSAMVQRVSGPVFIVTTSTVFSCMPQDVAQWKLDLFEFNAGWGLRGLATRAQRAIGFEVKPKGFWGPRTTIRLHTGGNRDVYALTTCHSASVQSIRDATSTIPSFSIITFDPRSVTILRLGDSMAGLLPTLLAQHWGALIAHVALPCVRRVFLVTDTIAPAALHVFLAHHPHVQELDFEGFHIDDGSDVTGAVVAPPLAHPGLTALGIKAFGGGILGRLVPGLAAAPQLRKVFFVFSHHLVPAELAGLVRDLHALAPCTNDLTLDIHLFASDRVTDAVACWSTSPEAQRAARALHCVRAVRLTIPSSVMGREAFAWVAQLPALQSFKLLLFISNLDGPLAVPEDAEPAATERLVEEARAALPHVQDVSSRHVDLELYSLQRGLLPPQRVQRQRGGCREHPLRVDLEVRECEERVREVRKRASAASCASSVRCVSVARGAHERERRRRKVVDLHRVGSVDHSHLHVRHAGVVRANAAAVSE